MVVTLWGSSRRHNRKTGRPSVIKTARVGVQTSLALSSRLLLDLSHSFISLIFSPLSRETRLSPVPSYLLFIFFWNLFESDGQNTKNELESVTRMCLKDFDRLHMHDFDEQIARNESRSNCIKTRNRVDDSAKNKILW